MCIAMKQGRRIFTHLQVVLLPNKLCCLEKWAMQYTSRCNLTILPCNKIIPERSSQGLHRRRWVEEENGRSHHVDVTSVCDFDTDGPTRNLCSDASGVGTRCSCHTISSNVWCVIVMPASGEPHQCGLDYSRVLHNICNRRPTVLSTTKLNPGIIQRWNNLMGLTRDT